MRGANGVKAADGANDDPLLVVRERRFAQVAVEVRESTNLLSCQQDGESLLFIPGLATRGERSEHQAAGSEISGIAGLRGRDGSWRQPWELSPEDARATPRELAESSAVAVASFDGKHSPALCAVTLCGWPFLPSQMSRAWLVARRSMASSREGETGIAVCVDALTLDIECYDLATGCPLPFDPGHDSDAELGT